jgi:succinate dehydrogenase / fumarate reductase membrane anchor subunit
MFWFILNLISFYDSEYVEVLGFFSKKSSQIFFSLFLIFDFLFSGLTVSEIFEDYIHDEKIKNVANKVLYIFAIIIPIITILCIYKISL